MKRKKIVTLTETELVGLIENLTLGHELDEIKNKGNSKDIKNHVESETRDANPIAKKAFDNVVGHLEATKGAFSLRNKSMTENLEDDKLKKTWKWKTNDGKVGVTVTVDVKMND